MKKTISVSTIFCLLFLTACGGGGSKSNGSATESSRILTRTSTLVPVFETESFTETDGSTVEAAKDEVLLVLRQDIGETETTAIENKIKELGGTVAGSDPDLMVVQIRTANESSMIAGLENMAGVLSASLNMVYEANGLTNEEGAALAKTRPSPVRMSAAAATADDPDLSGDWWMDAIKIREAWSISKGSPDVTIGIVDSGLKADQKILAESRLIGRFAADGTSLKDDDTAGLAPPVFTGWHGLWVTGFAAGFVDDPDNYDNVAAGRNVRGVNHASRVVMVDVASRDGKKVATDVLGGIKTAIDKGAKIVNVSWSRSVKGCISDACRTRRSQYGRIDTIPALELARKNKALVVISAGNDGVKDDDELFLGIKDEESALWRGYSVVVGASQQLTSSAGTPLADWSGSRMGTIVDILAPGEDVGFSQSAVDVINAPHYGTGTSYAAPLVTGVSSLLLSVNNTLLPPETKYLITSSAGETVDTKHTPKKHLDADAAVRSAKLLDGISLSELATVEFTEKNQKQSVSLPVTIPTTGISAMDVMFLIDVSGSYADDIATMKSRAADILASLGDQGIDVQFGVASFCDFPISPYGATGDNAFIMRQTLTSDRNKVVNAINALTIQYGMDAPEAQYEGLYQAATTAGWREGALHIIALSTDASFHNSASETGYPGKSSAQALAALEEKNIRVVGLRTGDTGGDLEDIVTQTEGQLFELASDSSGIATAMVQMLENTTASFEVAYQILGGNEFMESITPAEGFVDVSKGGSVTFTANLTNPKSRSFFKDQNYEIVLWVKANDSIIKRIRIPIEIDAISSKASVQ